VQVIPYRESKLTQAVRDFFIGQAKGRMIINISPSEEDFEETLHVLDFANTAKEVSTNVKRAGRVPATPSVARLPATVLQEDARGVVEQLMRKLEDMQQTLYDKDVELANKEMEVREECTTVMARRLQEMEVMNRESVDRARAFAEDKYEKKIEILSQFIQFQTPQPQQQQQQQQQAKTPLEELAAQLDADHWKRQFKELEETLEAKDKTIKSLQFQLQEQDRYRKELVHVLKHPHHLEPPLTLVFTNELQDSCKAQLAEQRKKVNEVSVKEVLCLPRLIWVLTQPPSASCPQLEAARAGHSTPKRSSSPIPKIVITPPKEDVRDLDCEESLSDDDIVQSGKRAAAPSKRAAPVARDSPYENKAAKRKRDLQQKRKVAESEDGSDSEESEDEQEARKTKKAVKRVVKTIGSKKGATVKKGPALKKRRSEESVSEMEEEASSEDEEQKQKHRGGTLRKKTKNAGNFFRECFTPEKKLRKKVDESPLVCSPALFSSAHVTPLLALTAIPTKKLDESFDKENAPSPVQSAKAKTATKAKRTLGRRTKVAN
jgi:hypothetical protein